MKSNQAHIQEKQDWLQIWQTWMTQHASIKWFYGFKLFVNLNRFMHTFYIKYLIVVSNIIRIHTLTYYRSPKSICIHIHIGKLSIGHHSLNISCYMWMNGVCVCLLSTTMSIPYPYMYGWILCIRNLLALAWKWIFVSVFRHLIWAHTMWAILIRTNVMIRILRTV